MYLKNDLIKKLCKAYLSCTYQDVSDFYVEYIKFYGHISSKFSLQFLANNSNLNLKGKSDKDSVNLIVQNIVDIINEYKTKNIYIYIQSPKLLKESFKSSYLFYLILFFFF